jgi:hypothetical protein
MTDAHDITPDDEERDIKEAVQKSSTSTTTAKLHAKLDRSD